MPASIFSLRNIASIGLVSAVIAMATETAWAEAVNDESDAAAAKKEEAAPEPTLERRRLYASLGLGFDFSRGDYGTNDETNALSIPAFFKLEWEPVSVRVSVPFLLINGSENVLAVTDGPTSDGGTVLGESYRYGLGDVSTSVTYTYYPTKKWVPLVDLRVKVKTPTADSDLGTQKTDTTLQFELTEQMGPTYVFGGFGYRFKGGKRYRDVLLGSVGGGYRLNKSVSAGLAFDWRQSSVKGTPSSKELSPSLNFKLGKHTRFSPYGVIGFSDASPDWGIGATTQWNF